MSKIMEVISSCTDCKFSYEMQEKGGNTFFALICRHCAMTNDDAPYSNNFLIATACTPFKYDRVTIPANCPLEDYKLKNAESKCGPL